MLNIDAIIRSDILCAIIFATLLMILYYETRLKRKTDRWVFLGGLWGLIVLITSIAAWQYEQIPLTSACERQVAIWTEFFAYMSAPMMILSTLIYAWYHVAGRATISRLWYIIPCVATFLVVLGAVYFTAAGCTVGVTPRGTVENQCLHLIFLPVCGLQMIYDFGFIFWFRRILGKRPTFILCLIHVICMFTLGLELWDPAFTDIGYFGMVLGFLLIAVYIPIEESIHARESAAAKSMFVASVSHDIRAPLNAILGFSALLKEATLNTVERQQALDAITSSGGLLMELINDVLDFSKIEQGMVSIIRAPTNVVALIDEVMLAFHGTTEGGKLRLLRDYADVPPLELDARRLRQVLFNLVGNAVKFTNEGEVTVHAAYMPDAATGAGTFVLNVTDTGIGIPEERQAELMKPYVQIASRGPGGGTGLGLYICRRLAEATGGNLTFVSEYGKGSSFTITLPNVKKAVTQPTTASMTGSTVTNIATNNPRHVLVVDDTELNLKVLHSMLKRLGSPKVTFARNGLEALNALRADRSIELVLTDLWMPEMDGNKLIAAIRGDSTLAHLPVFAVTADIEIVNKPQTFNGVLFKPVTLAALRKILEETPITNPSSDHAHT